MARGGFREGSGRKIKREEGRTFPVSFCCTERQKKEIDRLVKKSGMSRRSFIILKVLGERDE
jgi:hypothetical protein